jgi:hypothetical protein
MTGKCHGRNVVQTIMVQSRSHFHLVYYRQFLHDHQDILAQLSKHSGTTLACDIFGSSANEMLRTGVVPEGRYRGQ